MKKADIPAIELSSSLAFVSANGNNAKTTIGSRAHLQKKNLW